jgi:Ser/Thr protein kinase RdoA (MazF antagonist)
MIRTKVLRQALSGFGMPRGHTRVLSTRFGKVCLVHTARDGRRTQVRLVSANEETQRRLEAEMAWLTHLARRHALAVPIPRPWRRGRFVSAPLDDGVSSPCFAIACSWVPGRHLNRGVRTADVLRAGELLARLHLANHDAPPDIADARGHWGIPRLFELATTLRDLVNGATEPPPGVMASTASALRGAHAHLADAWRRLPAGHDQLGLIHTDSHWQNLRWSRHAVGLVDFEDMATGRYMVDVACLWSKLEARRDAQQLLDALLDGYGRVRPLTQESLRDLHVMLAFRRFDYAGWVLSWPTLAHQPWGPAFLDHTPAYIERWLSR